MWCIQSNQVEEQATKPVVYAACFLLMTPGLVWILTWTVYWYMIYFEMSDWWGLPLVLFVLTDGEREDLWWSALSGHWLSCIGCCQYLLNMKYRMSGLLFLQLSSALGCFRPVTSFISYLHATLKITIWGVLGLVSGSLCGVWGRGWTTCLFCDDPIGWPDNGLKL